MVLSIGKTYDYLIFDTFWDYTKLLFKSITDFLNSDTFKLLLLLAIDYLSVRIALPCP